MTYTPFAQREPDGQYGNLLADILADGVDRPTRQGPVARTLMQRTMQFPMTNGFPMIIERDISGFWRKAIGELCAFINGATTRDELAAFGCDWWGPWTEDDKCARYGLPPGELGPASYGGAFARFPTGMPGGFDQFEALVRQLREQPNLRTHIITPWVPHLLTRAGGAIPRATIAPCHGWVHVNVLGGRLHLHMMQRSGDVPVGVPSNMVQYAALLLMLSHLTGIPAGTYHHTISDAHVYADQIDHAWTMVKRSPRRLPSVHLTDAGRQVSAIHAFRGEHFRLEEYEPHPTIQNIPVAA